MARALERIQAHTSIMSVQTAVRKYRQPVTFQVGVLVRLKGKVPAHLKQYVGIVFRFESSLGDFSDVSFGGAGEPIQTVKIQTSFLESA